MRMQLGARWCACLLLAACATAEPEKPAAVAPADLGQPDSVARALAAMDAREKAMRVKAYEDAWRRKVEKESAVRFREEAGGRSGNLGLRVTILADGRVESITLVRSSGDEVLDRFAVSIVERAAPFAPFSAELARDHDKLVFSRPFSFGTPPSAESTAAAPLAPLASCLRSVDSEPSRSAPEREPGTLTIEQLLAEAQALQQRRDHLVEGYQMRPRKKFIGATPKDARVARYAEAWLAKVERAANADLPAELRGKSGTARMTAEICSNGAIVSIEFDRSSGDPAIDRALVRVVERTAPFAPFDGELARDTDVVVITRTWRFGQAAQ